MIRFSDEQLEDWVSLSKLADDQLLACFSALSTTRAFPVSGPDMRAEFEQSGLASESALILVRQLLSLRSFARTSNKSPEHLVGDIYEGFEHSFLDRSDVLENLAGKREVLTRLLESASVSVASKTHQLGQDHENVLISSSTVTDIRPVFRPGRDDLAVAMIVNYLNLEVSEQGNRRSVRYVVDHNDVDRLIKQLHDLKKKTEVASSLVKSKLQIRTFVVGDDSFGS